FKARLLNLSRGVNAAFYIGRGFSPRVVYKLPVPYWRDLDVYVYPVEKRAGHLRPVLVYLHGAAAAFLKRVAMIAAGAWVHGGHEHQARGIRYRGYRPRYRNDAVFERLPQ